MPQLEMGDYAPQIFWLVVTFVALMLIMWSVGLPRIRRVIEARENKISEDLADAESAKGKAESKASEEMQKIAGGLNLPPGLNLPF